MNTYAKIEEVLKQVGRQLAKHEFRDTIVTVDEEGEKTLIQALKWIGCSEETLGRRLREMREEGRVVAQRRAGKNFIEYVLATALEPVCPI